MTATPRITPQEDEDGIIEIPSRSAILSAAERPQFTRRRLKGAEP
jgi:hypothetical protein